MAFDVRPSKAEQWIHCNMSLAAEAKMPEVPVAQITTDGTNVHRVAEHGLSAIARNLNVGDPSSNKLLNPMDESQEYAITQELLEDPEITPEILEWGHDCVHYGRSLMDEHITSRDCKALVEHKVKIPWIPNGSGTVDFAILTPGRLIPVDWKSGRVPVDADWHYQMMLYAGGLIKEFNPFYDFKEVEFHIFMPRLERESVWTIKVPELMNWLEQVAQPAALNAYEGIGEYNPGESQCRYCAAKSVCRARAKMFFKVGDIDMSKPPDLLTDDEIAEAVSKADELAQWSEDIRAYALQKSLSEGITWKGLKIVESRTKRMYRDADMVATRLKNQGFAASDIYETKLIGILKLQKLLGKKIFGETVGDLLFKPKGSPKLVPDTDKRPEYSPEEHGPSDSVKPVNKVK
nr:hypothetical protein 44 [Burkholderiaceae bacterium]